MLDAEPFKGDLYMYVRSLTKEGQQLALIRKFNTLLIRKRSNLQH